jgi:RNA polymerase sigma factor for flagellar operon FliA
MTWRWDEELERASKLYLRSRSKLARERLCEAGLPLVRRMATHILRRLPAHFEVDDLIGDGCVGLLRAIDRFDPARGRRFEIWAARLIRGAMLNGLRQMDMVPERVRRDARNLEHARWHLAQREGTAPSHKEAAASAGLTRRKLNAVLLALRRSIPVSLDQPPTQRPESLVKPMWYDRIDAQVPDPAIEVARRASARAVIDAVRSLSERERLILRSFYRNGSTFRTIGGRLGITKQRVSQIHGRALETLRAKLGVARASS